MDHLQKLKQRLLDKHNFELPDGWQVKYSKRRKEGARPDPYYYSPDYDKNNLSSPLRSIPNVERYLGLYVNQTVDTVEDLFKKYDTTELGGGNFSVIYILTNPRYPEIKIGHSTGAVGRIKNFNTGSPEDFRVYKTFKSPFPIIKNKTRTSSPKTKTLEKIFHARYDHVRVPSGREFFNVNPDAVIDEFETDIEYLTRCQEHTPELVDSYLNLMLDIAKSKSVLDTNNA